MTQINLDFLPMEKTWKRTSTKMKI